MVFTLPAEIAAIALQNKAVVYGILFRAVAETLQTIAADPKHLGGEIGFFAVLHTWGSNLSHHPHLHVVVPGGGLSPDGNQWISCRPGYFLPVQVLSRLFRRLFIEALLRAFSAGELGFFSALSHLKERDAFQRYLAPVRRVECRVGGDVTVPTPHSPERADFPHSVLHEREIRSRPRNHG